MEFLFRFVAKEIFFLVRRDIFQIGMGAEDEKRGVIGSKTRKKRQVEDSGLSEIDTQTDETNLHRKISDLSFFIKQFPHIRQAVDAQSDTC